MQAIQYNANQFQMHMDMKMPDMHHKTNFSKSQKQLINAVNKWGKARYLGAAKIAAILAAMRTESDLGQHGTHNWLGLATPPKATSVNEYLTKMIGTYPNFRTFLWSKDTKSASQWARYFDDNVLKKMTNKTSAKFAPNIYTYLMMLK